MVLQEHAKLTHGVFDFRITIVSYSMTSPGGICIARSVICAYPVIRGTDYFSRSRMCVPVLGGLPNPPSASAWIPLFRAPFTSRSMLKSQTWHSNIRSNPRCSSRHPQKPHVMDVPDSIARSVITYFPSRIASYFNAWTSLRIDVALFKRRHRRFIFFWARVSFACRTNMAPSSGGQMMPSYRLTKNLDTVLCSC